MVPRENNQGLSTAQILRGIIELGERGELATHELQYCYARVRGAPPAKLRQYEINEEEGNRIMKEVAKKLGLNDVSALINNN